MVTVTYTFSEYGKEDNLDDLHNCYDFGYNHDFAAYEVRKINDDGEHVTVGYADNHVIKYTVVAPMPTEEEGSDEKEEAVPPALTTLFTERAG